MARKSERTALVTTFTIVNGPHFAAKVKVLHGCPFKGYDGDELIEYDEFKCEPTDFGQFLMVRGTLYVFSDDCSVILFAHPDYLPTALDLKNHSLHLYEVCAGSLIPSYELWPQSWQNAADGNA